MASVSLIQLTEAFVDVANDAVARSERLTTEELVEAVLARHPGTSMVLIGLAYLQAVRRLRTEEAQLDAALQLLRIAD